MNNGTSSPTVIAIVVAVLLLACIGSFVYFKSANHTPTGEEVAPKSAYHTPPGMHNPGGPSAMMTPGGGPSAQLSPMSIPGKGGH